MSSGIDSEGIKMTSAIKDNRGRGKVGDFLQNALKDGASLSFVSAYFTIYAFDKLKDKLQRIDHLNFLFGEPRFVDRFPADFIFLLSDQDVVNLKSRIVTSS